MNENTLQNKRMNLVVFGFVMLSSLTLVTMSKTTTFKAGIDTRIEKFDKMPSLISFPVYGFYSLTKSMDTKTEHFTVRF